MTIKSRMAEWLSDSLWTGSGWKGLTEAGGARKELAQSEVAEGGMGWGLGSLPSSPFSPLSLCPNLDQRACSQATEGRLGNIVLMIYFSQSLPMGTYLKIWGLETGSNETFVQNTTLTMHKTGFFCKLGKCNILPVTKNGEKNLKTHVLVLQSSLKHLVVHCGYLLKPILFMKCCMIIRKKCWNILQRLGLCYSLKTDSSKPQWASSENVSLPNLSRS